MPIITGIQPRMVSEILSKWLPLFESVCGPLLNVRKALLLIEEIGRMIGINRMKTDGWNYNGKVLAQEFVDHREWSYCFTTKKTASSCLRWSRAFVS
jgi:hypothetical protein